MKHIIVGTNRRGSRTRQLAEVIHRLYQDQGEEVGIIDLAQLPFEELTGEQYQGGLTPRWVEAVNEINHSEGLIFVVPEYNGSLPGALKYFMDHWKYPDSYEYRPVCFVGLGAGPFSGIRPIEHLQHIMGYRNAFQFPVRVFLTNVSKNFVNGEVQDPNVMQLLKNQVVGFQKYVKALESQGLDANSINARKVSK
jgi:NAD(P)H-dependent FMN reductase